MRNKIKIIGALLSIITSLFLSFGASSKNTIKIGFIGPLTGDYANYGKLMSQAIKIAVEEKNNAGGINGINVELIAEDSEGKVDKANAAIEKLASVNKIYGLVGEVFSSSSLAIAPRCEEEKIVMISPSSTHKDLTAKGKFIFRDVASDSLQATIFAKYIINVLKIKKLAILYAKNDYSQGLSENLIAQYEADGGTVVAKESCLQGDKDFKTQLTKIKSTKPEAIFLPNYVAEIAQQLEQIKQLGLNVKVLSADGFTNPEILSLAQDLANGVVFSGPPKDEGMVNAKTTDFENKYQKKWGEKPDNFSLNSYDAANILMDAIQYAYNKANNNDKKKLKLNRDLIREYVAQITGYQGVSGDISFDQIGDVIKNQGILTVENRNYKQLGVYTLKNNNLVQVK